MLFQPIGALHLSATSAGGRSPFWAAAEDLDMAIGFHEGGSRSMPTVGIDRYFCSCSAA